MIVANDHESVAVASRAALVKSRSLRCGRVSRRTTLKVNGLFNIECYRLAICKNVKDKRYEPHELKSNYLRVLI